jgi:hypothetical protein
VPHEPTAAARAGATIATTTSTAAPPMPVEIASTSTAAVRRGAEVGVEAARRFDRAPIGEMLGDRPGARAVAGQQDVAAEAAVTGQLVRAEMDVIAAHARRITSPAIE